MVSRKREKLLKIIFWLALVGLLTSFYLVNNHYAPPTAGSVCDISASVSCSAVNISVYSEILSIPVSLLGVLWFLVMLYLVNSIKKSHRSKLEDLTNSLFVWNIIGIISVFYFVWAEYMLKAICPFCTIVHVITVITLILSYKLYKDQEEKINLLELIKKMRGLLITLIIIFLIFLVYFNMGNNGQDYDEFAKCLTEKDVSMYGSFRCGNCLQTKKDFDDSFKYIDYIECDPLANINQYEKCAKDKKVEGFPTWIMETDGEEVKRIVGYKELDVLADFFGCEIKDGD